MATVIGVPLGLFAGLFRRLGRTSVISRLLDALFAFPVILMAIAILAITGVGLKGRDHRDRTDRDPEVRPRLPLGDDRREGERLRARGTRRSDARPRGSSSARFCPIRLARSCVLISLGFAFAILNETALSFLGLGCTADRLWGADLAAAAATSATPRG